MKQRKASNIFLLNMHRQRGKIPRSEPHRVARSALDYPISLSKREVVLREA
jgi:hypothetical protein